MQQSAQPMASPDIETFLNNPKIAANVFFPRLIRNNPPPDAADFNIPIGNDISLGARWYLRDANRATVLIFHGNAETVPDYDSIAKHFLELTGLNVFVVDYRGYGWSTGRPTLGSLLNDAKPVVNFFLRTLEEHNQVARARPPRPILFGRSLGSIPASEIAASDLAEKFSALIIDSGFSDVRLLLELFRIDVGEFKSEIVKMFSNELKLKQTKLPTLIIHGEKDQLIPLEHAQKNYDSLPEEGRRQLLIVPNAGHNDLLLRADIYFSGIDRFAGKFAQK